MDWSEAKSIAERCNTDTQFVYYINTGKFFTYVGDYTYPIRGKHSAWRKLSTEDVYAIRLLYKKGYKQREIALLYRVTQPCVSDLLRGKSYGHLEVGVTGI